MHGTFNICYWGTRKVFPWHQGNSVKKSYSYGRPLERQQRVILQRVKGTETRAQSHTFTHTTFVDGQPACTDIVPVTHTGEDGRCMLVREASGGQWQRTGGLEMEGVWRSWNKEMVRSLVTRPVPKLKLSVWKNKSDYALCWWGPQHASNI